MFPAAKAQFDLALAWSEFAMSSFTATTMIATAGAKVIAASAEAEHANRNPGAGPDAMVAAWAKVMSPAPKAAAMDPMRLAFALSEATMAFWSALLDAPGAPSRTEARPASAFWWTSFGADPAAPRSSKLH